MIKVLLTNYIINGLLPFVTNFYARNLLLLTKTQQDLKRCLHFAVSLLDHTLHTAK